MNSARAVQLPRVRWFWVLPPLATSLVLLALFPLCGLALVHAVSGAGSAGARLARVMLGIFAVVYAGFDTFAGLATGTIVRSVRGLGAAEQAHTLLAVKNLFTGAINGTLFMVGTTAWMIGAGAVAYTLWWAGTPRPPVVLIAIAAPLLFLDHPAPFGPVTFAAVAAALAWLAWRSPAKD